MGNWNFLGGVLEEVHVHSTVVGKIWLSVLFLFRMLVLGVAAEDAWIDEQEDFICNTAQPGCRNVCYDRAFPISLIRYWVLQVILVSSPSLVYMGHAVYRLRALEKERQKKRALLWKDLELIDVDLTRRTEREMKHLDQTKLNKAPLRGALLRTYVAHIIVRSAVEVAFMAGQYLMYGFQLGPLYKCEQDPCPNAVDCYVSRPTEKSVFMVFMQSIAALSLSLSILEIMHLCYKKIRKVTLDFWAKKGKERDDFEAQSDKVMPICSRASQKQSTPSVQNDLELIERKKCSNIYPELIKTSTFLPPQLATQRCYSQSACAEPRPSFHISQIYSKEKSEGFYLPHSGDKNSQRKNKKPSKCLQRAAHASLQMRSARRPKEDLDSFKCAPMLEAKRSDTKSYGDTKVRRGTPCDQMTVQPIHGSLDDCSTNSGCDSSLPSSNCQTSAASDTSSRRAADLQV
uniref:Gap junction protein n=1 Tax=Oryzias sinensis TaxID=183150 RepID=A0A8C7ZN16_9TELE